jgi:DHA3 family macrolide efflux protein-like MFS transporter
MEKNQYKNFIIFWASQAVSQLGSSMTGFALIIWAYKQTESAMLVSLLTFFSYLPYIFVSLFAGSFVDKHKKKNILLWSDSIAFLCSVSIVILLITGKLQIWHIYIVNVITGFMNSFQSPASSVAIGIMVPKDKLSNASGMNSLSSSMLTVITPMLASFISSFWGLKGVITIDMLTFGFAFSVLLFFIKIPEVIENVSASKSHIFDGCKEGFSFILKNKGLWYLILSMALMNFFSRLTYENILPAMLLARSGGNDNILGIVSGLLGVGGIVGGLYVSFFKLPKNSIKMIYFSAALSFIMGDLLMGVGQNVWIWCIAGLAASVPIPFVNAGQNVIIYNHISTEMQGRIFAVRNAVQYVTIPIGILLGGFLADYVFEPFMQSGKPLAFLLQKIVGTGAGSGMAVMFLCTGILGCATSILWYRNSRIRKLK